MNISKKYILESIKNATKIKDEEFDECGNCFIHYLRRCEELFEKVNRPSCSEVKKLLDKQYRTSYFKGSAFCKAKPIPAKEILLKVSRVTII